jgi:hypothetical protein
MSAEIKNESISVSIKDREPTHWTFSRTVYGRHNECKLAIKKVQELSSRRQISASIEDIQCIRPELQKNHKLLCCPSSYVNTPLRFRLLLLVVDRLIWTPLLLTLLSPWLTTAEQDRQDNERSGHNQPGGLDRQLCNHPTVHTTLVV